MITKRQLGLAAPTALKSGRLDQKYDALVSAMTRCAILSPVQQQMFLANILEETGELQAMEENLHYPAWQLRKLWPGIFDGMANADQVAAGGPESVANVIYNDAYRPTGYKLGNDQLGDGYKYRGRAWMQTTGKGNYQAYFRRVGLPLDTDPDVLLQPEHEALSAAVFWQDHGCNELATQGRWSEIVHRLNGGETNMATRDAYRQRLVEAMAHPDPADEPKPTPPAPPPPVEDIKPKPQLEPVPPVHELPPVPPKNYEVAPSGNVVINDPKNSAIVKKAGWGQVLGWFAAGLTSIGGALAQFKAAFSGLFGSVQLTDTIAICLTVLGVTSIIAGVFVVRSAGKDRIRMWLRGIA